MGMCKTSSTASLPWGCVHHPVHDSANSAQQHLLPWGCAHQPVRICKISSTALQCQGVVQNQFNSIPAKGFCKPLCAHVPANSAQQHYNAS
eukprot:1140250-Pelagomonas_calceolata.AAC.4